MRIRYYGIFAFILCLFTVCILSYGSANNAVSSDSEWVTLPYKASVLKECDYLYIAGGYYSIDNGCTAWGTADPKDIRYIGDLVGDIVIEYESGAKDDIPLIFGYTMWFYQSWKESTMPFKTDNADTELALALKSSLHLYGAFESSECCVFRIKVRQEPIKSILLEDNSDKNGEPVIYGCFMANNGATALSCKYVSFNASDEFFGTHTINSTEPYPKTVSNNIDKINRALMTYEDEYTDIGEYAYPNDYEGFRLSFGTSAIEKIAGNVVNINIANLISRTDSDGFIHTSYKDAPSWRYDGFGFWVPNANSYFDSFYSRDGARAIMTLNTFGYTKEAEAGVMSANKYMMYFPENNITFMGKNVPGHYTVVVNKPMIYSTVLVPDANWPTRYTQNKFGEDYQNLGNQETDGHGLMMMANYSVWKSLGSTAKWVDDNWTYINEAAEWIIWCLENPDLSFASSGLLYAESEAGMMEYTLYCNVACYLGMLSYSEMAETAGKTDKAVLWKEYADTMKTGINKRFNRGNGNNKWPASEFGFYHDPVVTMLSDIYGYDLNDMDQSWVSLSRNTYTSDVKGIADLGYFGASGIGYNHSMITQNALLLDQMSDASKLMVNLSKLSCAPGLPEPYMIPECIAVDSSKGVIRRQGDLGNLVQQAEALKCYAITMGVSPVNNDILKLMPRLPEQWDLKLSDHIIQNTQASIDMFVKYPVNGQMTVQLTIDKTQEFEEVMYRFGPLPSDTACAAVQINGTNTACTLEVSGDSAWVWVSFMPEADKEQKLALIYAPSVETLPSWPSQWSDLDTLNSDTNGKSGTDSTQVVWIVGICVIAVIIVASVIIVKRKRMI